ncbi:MAG: DUF5702 domain-containing protein [Firmicutes bacterium]|nr:DUF5702 domain-containing protein [Bacillota bacterium]
MRNRRGSFTVAIVLIFSAMLIMTGAVLSAAGNMAVFSTAEDFGRLWGTSILAEYDLNLKDRYGLFGFLGDEVTVEKKLDSLAVYTFGEKKYINYEGSACSSLKQYSLAEPENLKQQIEEAVRFGNKPCGLNKKGGKTGQMTEDAASCGNAGNRSITSRWILDGLPSAGARTETDIAGIVSKIRDGAGIRSLIGSSLVNQYIFTYFQHDGGTAELGDTFLQNEVEYILTGNPSDAGSEKKVRKKLTLLRNLLNLTYLYGSSEKREAAMTVASVMTPGPEAAVTQGVLLELWAYAEAENDVRLLYDQKTVPLLKQDQNWALTLENAMADTETAQQKYVNPPVTEGQNYVDYLRIMINAVPEKTRLLRIMDLIQINMKYLYCDCFLLEDYYAGVQFTLQVNGEKHEFTETYDRQIAEENAETGKLSG